MAVQGPTPVRRPTSRPADGKAGMWIQLERAKTSYNPGDLIDGTLSLILTKRTTPGRIYATFEGAIHTCHESKDPEVGGCVTSKLTLISTQQVIYDSTNPLEPGTYTWSFKLQIPATITSASLVPSLAKWKGPLYLGVEDRSGAIKSELPPTTRLRHNDANRNCDHCFIEYRIQASGPKVRTNLVFSKAMTAVYPVNLVLNNPSLLDTIVLDAPYTFTNKVDKTVASKSSTDSKASHINQSFPFDVTIKFPSQFQLDNPQPFPFVVTLTVSDIAKITTESLSQIDFTDFHLELQAHTEYLTKSDTIRTTNLIPLPRYYRPIRHSLELRENDGKQLIAQFDAGHLIGLNVPGDQGDRKLWPLQSAERVSESCPPSFTTWIWKRWYELSFRFVLIWESGSGQISSGWPSQEKYVIKVLAPSNKVMEAKSVEPVGPQPPTYASLGIVAAGSATE